MTDKGELYVIIKTRDLLGYVTEVTQKSPKVYRFTYIDRMIHLCIDVLALFLEANEVRVTSSNWEKRGAERVDMQRRGISKLRLLSYLAFISQEGNTNILTSKQYLQIIQRVDECIRYAQAWMKGDTNRLTQLRDARTQ